jgi:polysaccharide deacetylase family protein (PEP-CTERM system associated)
MLNAMTVDLEDWYQGLEVVDIDAWGEYESRIDQACRRLLAYLDRYDTKATFFVLGYLAERNPEIVKRIHDSGHEIGSHGFSHTPVYRLSPVEFESELSRTNDLIHDITGHYPVGFRSPFFSIVKETYWAFDVLANNGFRYDSSIFPTWNYRYGIRTANPRRHEIETDGSGTITEIPVSTCRVLGYNFPVGGGAYFRILPYFVTRFCIKRCNRKNIPFVFYIHPWEFDPEQPVLPLPKRIALTHYHRIGSTGNKFEKLLSEFRFSTVSEVFSLN